MINFSPVTIDTGIADEEGMLAYRLSNRLVAVLVRLGDIHGELSGCWFIEVVFMEMPAHDRIFADLDRAREWLENHMINSSIANTQLSSLAETRRVSSKKTGGYSRD